MLTYTKIYGILVYVQSCTEKGGVNMLGADSNLVTKSITIDKEILEWIKELSAKEMRSVSNEITYILKQYKNKTDK